MAFKSVEATQVANEGLVDLVATLKDACDGPGDAPYADGRKLAGWLSMFVPSMGLSVTGTTALDADSDGAGEWLEIKLDFTPKFALIYNQTAGIIYVKLPSMAAANAIKIVAAGSFTFATPTVKFANNDDTDLKAVSLDGTDGTAADVIHYYIAG